MNIVEEDQKKATKKMAVREKAMLNAMLAIINSDGDEPVDVNIGGLNHAFSSAKPFRQVIRDEIKEINKALKGEPSTWI